MRANGLASYIVCGLGSADKGLHPALCIGWHLQIERIRTELDIERLREAKRLVQVGRVVEPGGGRKQPRARLRSRISAAVVAVPLSLYIVAGGKQGRAAALPLPCVC